MRARFSLAVVFAAAVAGVALTPAVRAGEKPSGENADKTVTKSDERSRRADRTDEVRKERRIERRMTLPGRGGFLGIALEDTKGDARGAVVRSVDDESPAAKAGLKDGDVVVRFDGEAVRSAAQLRRLVGETPAGRTVPIEVTRAGASQTLRATLGERRAFAFDAGDMPGLQGFRFELPEAPEAPEPPMAPRPPRPRADRFGQGDDVLERFLPGVAGPRKLGLQYIEMGAQLAEAYKLKTDGGVLVTAVDEDGPAHKAGIRAGDVILQFDGKALASAEDLREAVDAAKGGSEVAITVQREGRPVEVKATLARPESRRGRARSVQL